MPRYQGFEVDDYVFTPDALPEGTSAATNRRIKEFVTGVPPGHRW